VSSPVTGSTIFKLIQEMQKRRRLRTKKSLFRTHDDVAMCRMKLDLERESDCRDEDKVSREVETQTDSCEGDGEMERVKGETK
jgi:hypothetical protein